MEVIIGIKPAPGDHKSNFKKVGSIPFGFNTMGTDFLYHFFMQIKTVDIVHALNFKDNYRKHTQ